MGQWQWGKITIVTGIALLTALQSDRPPRASIAERTQLIPVLLLLLLPRSFPLKTTLLSIYSVPDTILGTSRLHTQSDEFLPVSQRCMMITSILFNYPIFASSLCIS